MAARSGADLEAQAETQPLLPRHSPRQSIVSRVSGSEGQSYGSEHYEDPDKLDDEETIAALDAISNKFEVPGDGNDIVQLSAPIYYTCEEEEFVRVEITRLGSHKGVVSVVFRPTDGSARAGVNYRASPRKIVFKSGQHTKAIDIPILQDGMWTPSTEFNLRLEKPKDCCLGSHLQAARVKVINDDPFPTEEYRDVVQASGDAIKTTNQWILYRHYLSFNFQSGGVKQQSILCMCLDQMSNVFTFVHLCVVVYMVDVVFDRGTQTRQHLLLKDRYHNAVLIGLWYVVPVLLFFLWDSYKARLDIEGTTRTFLQNSMMKTFLNYTEKSRSRVTPSDLDIAISGSSTAVARGYVAGISIPKSIGKIFAVLLFISLYRPQMQAICVVAFMPVLLLIFTAVRLEPTQRAEEEVATKKRDRMILTHEACNKYRLIHDYFKRYTMANMFSSATDEHKEAVISQMSIRLVTVYVTKFLSGFFICTYIITNAQAVLEGQLSLGLFLATINIFGTYLADAITELNNNLETIIESLASIEDFTLHFNLPLELMHMKNLSHNRHQRTSELRKTLFESRGADFADAMEIRLENVTFSYYDPRTNQDSVKFDNLNIITPQGTMVAVTGPHASFKKTLLEMLSDIVHPSSGFVFIPSHLQVLHVSLQPQFVNMSLLDNLTLGLPRNQEVAVDRIKSILRIMKLPDFCIEQIDREFQESAASDSALKKDKGTPRAIEKEAGKNEELNLSHAADVDWLHMLSHTQLAMLHVGRALIANPNVLILQRPLHHFIEDTANVILKVFREHVESRGLGYAAETKSTRRPRTLFVIPETKAQANTADVIWSVNPETKSVDVTFPLRGWLG